MSSKRRSACSGRWWRRRIGRRHPAAMVGEEVPRHRLGASGLQWVDVEGLGVRAELGYAERERGSGCGRGGCERRRRRLSVGRTEEGKRSRESERASGWGLRGVADGVQGDEGKAASRRWPGHRQRSPPSCFGARGGRRQGGTPGGLGRTGAGPAGLRGERRVRFLSSLLLFLFNSVFYFL